MKIIFSLLILLSISFNTHSHHDETLTLDGFSYVSERIILKIYNKTDKQLSPSDYLWIVSFGDGAVRKYKSSGMICPKYSDCDWAIHLNRADFSFEGQVH